VEVAKHAGFRQPLQDAKAERRTAHAAARQAQRGRTPFVKEAMQLPQA
jgi:hypothetical protein